MDKITQIKNKIDQIEEVLSEIRSIIESLQTETRDLQYKTKETEKSFPTIEELRKEYELLYSQYINSNSQVVEDFVKGKSKGYLKQFCKANSIAIDTTKASKIKIAQVIAQWMAQRKAITQKAV